MLSFLDRQLLNPSISALHGFYWTCCWATCCWEVYLTCWLLEEPPIADRTAWWATYEPAPKAIPCMIELIKPENNPPLWRVWVWVGICAGMGLVAATVCLCVVDGDGDLARYPPLDPPPLDPLPLGICHNYLIMDSFVRFYLYCFSIPEISTIKIWSIHFW